MSSNPNVPVRVTRRFDSAPERVFDAWLDPDSARRWLFATPSGEMVRAEIDARVGGTYVLVDRRDGEDVVHTGEYLEIDRPRRLVFTFLVEKYSRHADRVTVEIVPRGEGSEVTLTYEMRPEMAEYAGRTREGWAGILGALARALGESGGR